MTVELHREVFCSADAGVQGEEQWGELVEEIYIHIYSYHISVTVVCSTVQPGACKDLSEIRRTYIALLSSLYCDSAVALCMCPNSCLDVNIHT